MRSLQDAALVALVATAAAIRFAIIVEAYNTSAFAATCVTLPLPRGSPAGEVALLERFFRGVVARRVLVVVAYALLIPPAVLLALRVGSDNSIDRLIVPSDPDYRQTRDFQDVFPEGQHVILLADAKDPFAPEVLRRVAALEKALASIPEVRSFSAVTLYERARPSFQATPEQAAEFKAFVSGSTLFRKQGLVGDDFLGIPIEILASNPAERDRILARIDAAAARAAPPGGALEAIRKVGRPYVDAYLEHETKGASLRYLDLNTFEYLCKTENRARLYFKKNCWKKRNVFCITCRSYKTYRISDKRYRCKRCGYKFHDFSVRWLNKVKISYNKWLWIIKLFELEVSARKIAQQVQLSYPTVLKAVTIIRIALVANSQGAQDLLNGEIELDESYFGGRRKGKRGRGAYNKVPVFGILERNGTVLVEVVKDVTGESLLSMTVKTVRRGSIVYTDKFRSYDSLMFCGSGNGSDGSGP